MAQPTCNQTKKMALVFESMLHSHLTKDIETTMSSAVKGVELRSNSNNSFPDITISGDSRTLCRQGRMKEALSILHFTDDLGICIDSSTYASLLQSCIDRKVVREGKFVHAHIIRTGFKCQEIFFGNTLVNMYAKCGSLVDARRVLEQMPIRNVVSWTVMISAYVRHGHSEEALKLFYQMKRTGIQPNQFTFSSVLPACANLASVERGKEMHKEIIRSGFQFDVFVGSALVDMYVKCGNLDDARQLFDKMPERNVVSWNAMIAGYAQNGFVDQATKLFQKMPERNVVSWTTMIAGYAQNGYLNDALKLFQKMPERNVVTWNTMVAGYAQSGHLQDALKLFQKMPERDVVSWNAVIAGYAQNGDGKEVLTLFHQMQQTGIKPNRVTFTSVLPACASLAALEHGKEVHGEIIRSGFESDVFVGSALVDMYVKCESIETARQVFESMTERNVVSWTAMISGYAQNGHVEKALKLFQKMPERNVVSWNAMIAGYAQNGHFDEALKIFQQMQLTGVKPNSDTFNSVLPACANLAALENGKEVHKEMIRSGFPSDVFAGSALVDMYAKCGTIEEACQVFEKMPVRNVVSWTAMIVGYAMHGYGKEALQLFDQMRDSGTKPDHVTFVGVLSACCHAGLVDYGWQYFNCMRKYYHITPAMEHYCCMVDLLGRAGRLDEAQDFINKMPIKPNAVVWGSLLGACRLHSNVELGEYVAERLFELDPVNDAPYVLLSNIYAGVGRWDEINKVRHVMKARGVKKKPGCSWIEVNKRVYTFVVGDRSYPQRKKIM
eukprot:Gb_36142 [translate_table: standard]